MGRAWRVRWPRRGRFGMSGVFAALLLSTLGSGSVSAAAAAAAPLAPCRLNGFEHEALCGRVARALNPAQPHGEHIDVHFAVLPALARNKLDDPVFFFAGGPGQSAIDLAGPVSQLLARVGNRRDIVLIDQRGTGRSAPLKCAPVAPTTPLRESISLHWQVQRLQRCRRTLQQLPYGDLRWFTTELATADADAVRAMLGARQIDLVGISYGTRAALDYMRQFPMRVRRVVLDGVAPADMNLPLASALDNQAAFDALLDACAADAACRRRHAQLREQWRALLDSLPRPFEAAQALTGDVERITLSRDALLGMVRAALYSPVLSSALPAAIDAAAQGRLAPLVGLSSALSTSGAAELAEGMHFAVVCSEDMRGVATPVEAAEAEKTAAADFGAGLAPLYREVCKDWPRGPVDAAFYTLPPARSATLLLSGGLDPVTPPRHARHVADALGPLVRQVVVANAGHGLMSLPCLRDTVYRFIDAATDAQALQVSGDCASGLPRPLMYVPIGGAGP